MVRIAVLGASGFIGSRVIEMLHLNAAAEVRPVVRRYAGLARPARFDLDCRVAAATDVDALRGAFAGCDVVLHAIAGDPDVILGTLEAPYHAAQAAGVRRLVYLSSASVHGQAPAAGTDESSPLDDRQPLAYNNAKVRAERKLHQLRGQGTVEIVILRPGIVYGPRATWITDFADALLAGRAYILDRGQGICNGIYIDNLVDAILLASAAPGVDGQAFLLGDREEITWADLYAPIAEALGMELEDVPEAEVPDFAPTWRDYFRRARKSGVGQVLLGCFPQWLRQAVYNVLVASVAVPPSPWTLPSVARPTATQEMALLYRCRTKLPIEKAQRELGYVPRVALAEACAQTVAWLAFAGYPVTAAVQPQGELWLPNR